MRGRFLSLAELLVNGGQRRARISPTGIVDAYNPRGEQFKDIYLIEKASTKEGWSPAAADENFSMGYQAEIQDFITCAATGARPQSDLDLALDTTATIYAAYLSDENKGVETEIPQL